MGLEGKRLGPRPLPAQGVYAGREVPELPVSLAQSLHLEEEAQVQGLAREGGGLAFSSAVLQVLQGEGGEVAPPVLGEGKGILQVGPVKGL